MSKGTGLVRSNPKPQNLPMSNKDAALLQQMIQQAHTQISKSYFTTNSTSGQYIPVNAGVSGISGAQRGIKVLDERNDMIFEITSRGDLFFYIDDHEKIVNALERLWKNQVRPLVVTQTEIDALAYAAGIYIREPKDINAIREKAWDRLEQLALGGNIFFEECDNPKLIGRHTI